MARTAIYLNFMGETEKAFLFYRKVFGTDFDGKIMYMRDVPPQPGQAELSEDEKNAVMHVSLPLPDDTRIMGTDMTESMGQTLITGNNISINLQPDTKEEADRIFKELSAGGSDKYGMDTMFWGDYWGSFVDKFGISWMINCPAKKTNN